jgi:Zn-dependent metalloprotease
MICRRACVTCIAPPYLLEKLLGSKDNAIRDAALNTLLSTAQLRGERSVRALTWAAGAPDTGRRTIYDCRSNQLLTAAVLARTEDGAPPTDESVNRAFDGFGATRDFFLNVLGRDSLDDRGMRLNGYVHYGVNYQNAFWDGQEMVFGDGDGVIFSDFTKSLDVIAHELTHGVTEFTAALEYHNQSGALNESISDVFGSLVKQWSQGQAAEDANWLIGDELFTPGIDADALRSMKAPGRAYDNNLIGKDPQPDHMSRFVNLPDSRVGDWGGVHINSGIPNRAFYLTAVGIGGYAWEAPGHIWYEALKASSARTQFQEFADTTYQKADQLYGAGSPEQQAVVAAWREVGIRISGVTTGPARGQTQSGGGQGGDTLSALTKQIAALSTQVKALAKDVTMLKGKK